MTILYTHTTIYIYIYIYILHTAIYFTPQPPTPQHDHTTLKKKYFLTPKKYFITHKIYFHRLHYIDNKK